MISVTRSQMMTTSTNVRLPVRWSTEQQCFVLATDGLKLGPNDRLDPEPHNLQMQGDGEGRFQLTIGARLTRTS
jgi:hypothetical protein